MVLKLIIVFLSFLAPTIVMGMSPEQRFAKFDSSKDYHHLYHNPRLMRSLQAICLGAIARDVKDNIDPDNPLESQKTIEEIIAQLKERDISSKCLFDYWQAHTQPTWDVHTIHNKVTIDYYDGTIALWFDKETDTIGILTNTIISYKPNPFSSGKKFDCIAISKDSKQTAVAQGNCIVFFSNQYPFHSTYTVSITNKDSHKAIPITALAFSADNTALFIGCADGNIVQCSYENKQNKVIGYLNTPINFIACSPNNSYIIVANSDGIYGKFDTTPDGFIQKNLIKITQRISKILISPDSNFIALIISHLPSSTFRNESTNAYLIDAIKNTAKLCCWQAELISFSPTNDFILYNKTDNVLETVESGSKSNKFYLPKGENPCIICQPQSNACYIHLEGNVRKGEGSKTYLLLTNPSLTQLLYKLAIEASIRQGKKKSLQMLSATNLIILNYLPSNKIYILNKEVITQRTIHGMKSINPQKVAQEFVARYIAAAWNAQEPLGSILNEEFLRGYDEETAQKICRLSHECWLSNMWQEASKAKDFRAQIACLNSKSYNYLLCTPSMSPLEYFNSLVENNSSVLDHLHLLHDAGVEQKIRDAYPFSKIASVKESIDEINRSITTMLHSNCPNQFEMLLSLYQSAGQDLKTRIKHVAKENAQKDQLRAYSWLREIFKKPTLAALFSPEEIDQLYHYPPAAEYIRTIQSTTYLPDCIQFIKEKLPRINLVKPLKKKLVNKSNKHALHLFTEQIEKSVTACRMQKQSLTMEHIYKSTADLASLTKIAAEHNDILPRTTTLPALNKAKVKMSRLKSKLLLRKKILHNPEDIPSSIKQKIERQSQKSELMDFITNCPQPSLMPRQRIDPTKLYGTALYAGDFK